MTKEEKETMYSIPSKFNPDETKTPLQSILKSRKISPTIKSISYSDSSVMDCGGCYEKTRFIGRKTQDWIFLTLLGILVALQSFLIDVFCDIVLFAHRWLYRTSSFSMVLQYLVWVLFPIIFICFSVGFCALVGPTAIGSGVPEIKTILHGVILKQHLTFRIWISKLFGLTFALASGMPLGKLGPFVHMGSMTANTLSKLFPVFRKEFRKKEFYIHILTAGAATGVSCIFAAPIGGVLFSIEATATYYAMKNYWRGFYAAMCGAITFRLLTSWSRGEETLTAFFKSNLRQESSYDLLEISMLIIFGAICGVFGALFVYMHKNTALFLRQNKLMISIIQKNRFIYPVVLTLIIFSLLFPPGLGQYYAGQLTLREAVNQMFDNRTWSSGFAETVEDQLVLKTWRGPLDNVLLTLFVFFTMRFWMCTTATTMPVPCGIFIPAFSLGAAFGRFTGESISILFPNGIRGRRVLPGAYSIIGAACLSGGMTHTVSPAIIAFELTGYLGHIIPCVISVAIAGAVANFLQPSAYDAMIQIKKLPFLPPVIKAASCNANEVKASDMMVRGVACIYLTDTLGNLLEQLQVSAADTFPVLDSPANRMFIGSIELRMLKEMILKTSEPANAGLVDGVVEDSDGEDEVDDVPSLEDFNRWEQIERRPSRFSVTRVNQDLGVGPSISEMTRRRSSRMVARTLLEEPVQDLQDDRWFNKKLYDIPYEKYVNMSTFRISTQLTLYKIHWIFSYLSLHKICVTENGKFVGIITLSEVLKAISSENQTNSMTIIDQEVINLLKQK